MRERFIRLIQDFCALYGMDNPMHVLNGGSIAVNGIVFSLTHMEKSDPDLLYIRCDFGEAPNKRLAEAYQALLEMNLYLYDGTGAAFSISPKTACVLFTKTYRLEALMPQDLQNLLGELVVQVHEWRNHHFLDPRPATRPHKHATQFFPHLQGRR